MNHHNSASTRIPIKNGLVVIILEPQQAVWYLPVNDLQLDEKAPTVNIGTIFSRSGICCIIFNRKRNSLDVTYLIGNSTSHTIRNQFQISLDTSPLRQHGCYIIVWKTKCIRKDIAHRCQVSPCAKPSNGMYNTPSVCTISEYYYFEHTHETGV